MKINLVASFITCCSCLIQSFPAAAAANLRGGPKELILEHESPPTDANQISEARILKNKKKLRAKRQEKTRQKRVANKKAAARKQDQTRQKKVANKKEAARKQDQTRQKKVANKKEAARKQEHTRQKKVANKKEAARKREQDRKKRAGMQKQKKKGIFK